MIANDFLRATMQFSVPSASAPVIMVWDWRCVETVLPITLTLDGGDIAEAIINRYLVPLTGALSNQLDLVQISLRSWEYPDDGYEESGILWGGTNAGALMPPANTLAIRLTRSNFSMRNGRKAFPGGTIGAVAVDGTVDSVIATTFNNATDAWSETAMEVEFDGGGASFTEVVIRVPTTPNTNPTMFYNVNSYGPVYWGTQNSRK